MHLLVRETRSLDEAEPAVDLEQTPGDLVVLSFTDSDLTAVAAAWRGAAESLPSLRVASLARLRHPLSTDLYVEGIVAKAKAVVVRVLGGMDYWRYGVEEVSRTCREKGIPLAFLPGDSRPDPRLAEHSTVTAEMLQRLEAYFQEGGPGNLRHLLQQMARLAGLGKDEPAAPQALAKQGYYLPGKGAVCAADCLAEIDPARPLAAVVFYRSYLLSGDLAVIDAVIDALAAEGIAALPLFVASLKDPAIAGWTARVLSHWCPGIVLNVTAFSAQIEGQVGTALDAAGVPVLQLPLAGSNRASWQASARGLSASDLAMQVVLPEFDGRLLTPAISFKDELPASDALPFATTVNKPAVEGIASAVRRARRWIDLAWKPRAERRLGLVLSDYPGGAGQVAHAVGLDAIASTSVIAALLREAGYSLPEALADNAALAGALEGKRAPTLGLAAYRAAFARLPAAFREQVTAAWGEPEDDPAVMDGGFQAAWLKLGKLLVAVQPDRGDSLDRKTSYHDPELPPRHAYIAFYLWLREAEAIDAMIHLGTHGTLEWLPGKAVALSTACAPGVLSGGLPVIYPFIVNNPGEAAAAKRRLSAVTLGHLTPPLRSAGAEGPLAELERLVDEYAAADGLDQRRMKLLREEIRRRGEESGLTEECGVTRDMDDEEALARLDAYLCDVKDLQIRDGLHVFGTEPPAEQAAALVEALRIGSPQADPVDLRERIAASAREERAALLAALDGRFVPPGPAGAPTRGRLDVLPTGRNLFTVDPRAVPTRSALVLGKRAAEDLVRRYVQEEGDWPKRILVDLWGSATMRTGGDELAMALALLGVEPLWDEGSNRVNGFEVLPIARMERPRVDVTLRVSGLYRDVFPAQMALFDRAVQAVARREESLEMNPLAAACQGLTGEAFRQATWRIFSSAPGDYDAGVSGLLASGAWQERAELGDSYLAAGGYAYDGAGAAAEAKSAFAERVGRSDAQVHLQDQRETDILDSVTYAAFQGGFAAAAAAQGAQPQLLHADLSDPNAPRTRLLSEELNRVVRGRLANPRWLAGMMRHGYRGGAEMARGLDTLFAFAATAPIPLSRQFDLAHAATLGDPEVDSFLRANNPAARTAMRDRFAEALNRGLWAPRRNALAAELLDREAAE